MVNKFVSIDFVCNYLNVTVSTVYLWVKKNRIKHDKLGGKTIIDFDSVQILKDMKMYG